MDPRIVLFGATGYTGHLVAEALVQRGLRPLLCGRNKIILDRLAADLGGLETAVAVANDEAALAALLSRGDILISTVGPFLQYGPGAVAAAVQKGAVYIDSAGEPAFVQAVFETFGPNARSAGATLITACAYEYVPGNCAAGIALSEAGLEAVRVDIGYFSKKSGRVAPLEVSQGTAASLRGAMLTPIKVWRSGRFIEESGGTRVRRFRIDGVESPALSISGTEHFSLPRVYPVLQEVNTYLGWFGHLTYVMQHAALVQSGLLKLPGYRSIASSMLSMFPESRGRGPDAAKRRLGASHIVAEAFDADGAMLSRAELSGVDGYTFTAGIIAWGAEMAVCGRILETGAVGPIEAFGLDALREGIRQSGLKEIG